MLAETELGPDILHPIFFEEWPVLQKLLKVDWPIYSFYYYWIENAIRWKEQDPDLAIQIYCPHGKYKEDATFVGIANYSWWSVIVFTKEPSGKRLHDALVETSRIDWSKGVTFSAVHAYIQPILFSALATLKTDQGIEIDQDIPGCFRIKSADECANVEIEVPEECYLGDLDSSHVPIIHSLWPHADKEQPENSMKLLRTTLTLNKSMGLFLKEGSVLVSWAFHNDWHGLGTVQTLEDYKRKGYAKVVVNALAKRLGKAGISPVLSVVCGNIPSETMFESLNWKRTVPATWVIMKKYLPTAK